MPKRDLVTPFDDERVRELRQRLVTEFRSPQEAEPEPIFIEQPTQLGTTRLYVIWSAWSPLNQRQRSEIIADAYQEARGVVSAAKLAFALGLTPDEARNMGVQYH